MRLYPETKIAFGLIVTFLLVVTGTALTYFNSNKAIESGKSVASGLELLAGLESFFLTLRTLDKESVSFAQSGSASSLSRFKRAEKTLDAHIEYIKQLGAKDVRRYVQITSMETVARTLVNRAWELVRQRQKSLINIEPSSSYRDRQQASLELIRSRIIYMESEEKEIIKRHNSVYEDETRRLFQTYAILGVFTVVFFFGLVFLLLRYIQSERRLVETERRVANEIVSHAPIGIMILNESLNIVSLNPTFSVYLRLETPPIGVSLFDVIPSLPDEVRETLCQLKSSISTKQSSGGNDTIEGRSFEIKSHPVLSDRYWDIMIWPTVYDKIFRGLIVLASDVTDKVMSNRQRQLFFSTLTHDLKNPLIGNQYLVRALMTDAQSLSSSQREGLEQLERGNEAILKMIKNILEISKLSDGTALIAFGSFDLRKLLTECSEELANFSNEKKVRLNRQFPSNEVVIDSDIMAVKHILLNLIENAVKFSDEGSEVTLRLECDEDFAVVSVQDNGPGITEEDRAKLFQSVWQGASGRREVGGSGIGMYLCNQLVQLLGGSLRFESSGALGSTFFVEIPRESRKAVSIEKSA